MNENVNISFIPKKPLARSESSRRRPGFGISFVISLTIAFLIIGVAVFQFFYIESLKKERYEKITALEQYEEDLQKRNVIHNLEQVKTFARQIDVAQSLLDRHIALSDLFDYLAEITPKRIVGRSSAVDPVVFKSFSYTNAEKGVQITMSGTAANYAVLAALSQLYKTRSDVIRDYSLTGYGLGKDGDVNFSLIATLDPSLVSYKKVYGIEEQGGTSVEGSLPSFSDVFASSTTNETILNDTDTINNQ